MCNQSVTLKPLKAIFIAAIAAFLVFGDNRHTFAQDLQSEALRLSRLDTLLLELRDPENENWQRTEEEIWREWAKSGSRAMDTLYMRGVRAMNEGDLAAAIDHFSALTDHAPDFAEGWNKRATVFFMLDEYGMSVADIEKTLALNPSHFGAMAGLGSILERVGKPKEALDVYTQALEIHPRMDNLKDAVDRLAVELEGTAL